MLWEQLVQFVRPICCTLLCIGKQNLTKRTEIQDTPSKVVNLIRRRSVNHRIFKVLYDETESQFRGLLYHTEVWWLSRGQYSNARISLKTLLKLINSMKAIFYFAGSNLNTVVQETNARELQVLWMMLWKQGAWNIYMLRLVVVYPLLKFLTTSLLGVVRVTEGRTKRLINKESKHSIVLSFRSYKPGASSF